MKKLIVATVVAGVGMMLLMKKKLNLNEVAQQFGYDSNDEGAINIIKDLIKRGEIKSFTQRGVIYVYKKDLDAYFETKKTILI